MKNILTYLGLIGIPLTLNTQVKAQSITSRNLVLNTVTSGDGLYIDNDEEGRYIYKGGSPNNYLKLNNSLYRIISIEVDGKMKIVKNDANGTVYNSSSANFDTKENRKSTNSEDYCNSDYGCNVWGSNTTTLDSNSNNVTQMPKGIGDKLYNLPDKEASLNTYLNTTWYNSLSDDIKKIIVDYIWNIGSVDYYYVKSDAPVSETLNEEATYKWKGKIALMNVTDYIKASTNPECNGFAAFRNYQAKESCHKNITSHNYLYSKISPWFLNPISNPYYSQDNLHLDSANSSLTGVIDFNVATSTLGVRPAFYISSETTLEGEGTKESPYTLYAPKDDEKDDEVDDKKANATDIIKDTIKDDKNSKTDNPQIVEVPATSAKASIIIASIGIIFISLAIIVSRKMIKINN